MSKEKSIQLNIALIQQIFPHCFSTIGLIAYGQ